MTVKTKKKAYNAKPPCQVDWKRGQTKYNGEDPFSTPMPESKLRRRVCRVCAMPVESKSYWYCHTHNTLSHLDDDNIIYTSHHTNVESY
jgi:hypothetical protein